MTDPTTAREIIVFLIGLIIGGVSMHLTELKAYAKLSDTYVKSQELVRVLLEINGKLVNKQLNLGENYVGTEKPNIKE